MAIHANEIAGKIVNQAILYPNRYGWNGIKECDLVHYIRLIMENKGYITWQDKEYLTDEGRIMIDIYAESLLQNDEVVHVEVKAFWEESNWLYRRRWAENRELLHDFDRLMDLDINGTNYVIWLFQYDNENAPNEGNQNRYCLNEAIVQIGNEPNLDFNFIEFYNIDISAYKHVESGRYLRILVWMS